LLQEAKPALGPVRTDAEKFDPRTVQPAASHYTDYAFLAHTDACCEMTGKSKCEEDKGIDCEDSCSDNTEE